MEKKFISAVGYAKLLQREKLFWRWLFSSPFLYEFGEKLNGFMEVYNLHGMSKKVQHLHRLLCVQLNMTPDQENRPHAVLTCELMGSSSRLTTAWNQYLLDSRAHARSVLDQMHGALHVVTKQRKPVGSGTKVHLGQMLPCGRLQVAVFDIVRSKGPPKTRYFLWDFPTLLFVSTDGRDCLYPQDDRRELFVFLSGSKLPRDVLTLLASFMFTQSKYGPGATVKYMLDLDAERRESRGPLVAVTPTTSLTELLQNRRSASGATSSSSTTASGAPSLATSNKRKSMN